MKQIWYLMKYFKVWSAQLHDKGQKPMQAKSKEIYMADPQQPEIVFTYKWLIMTGFSSWLDNNYNLIYKFAILNEYCQHY